VSSAVMTRIENERDTEAKDKEFEDIWCEVPESKTHSECDISKELWGKWSMEEETYIDCGCKERNLWNYLVRVLGLMKGSDENTVVVLDCGGL
jgi:hypothetical protein